MAICAILLLAVGVFGGVHASDCVQLPNEPNVALDGDATQSSSVASIFSAKVAIDGNRDGTFTQQSCTHTGNEIAPWWKLDLKQQQKIYSVIVANRQDCCWERLQGAEVRIGNSPDGNNPVCGTITDVSAGPIITLCCNGMEGRYVSVVIPGRREVLTLCELEVYGVPAKKDDGC